MTTIATRTPIQSAPKPTATAGVTQVATLKRDVAAATGFAAKGAAYHRIADGVTDPAQRERLFRTFYAGLAASDQTAVIHYFAGVTAAARVAPTVAAPAPAAAYAPAAAPAPVAAPAPIPAPPVALPDPISYLAAHPQVGTFLASTNFPQYGSQAGDAIAFAKITADKQTYGSQYDLYRAAQEATRTHQHISF